MAHQGLNWRIAIVVIAMVMSVSYGLFLNKGPRYVIQIEFGIFPAELEGTEVVIDGEVVGQLTRRGARTRTGFEVDEGDHVISLKHATFPSEPRTVTSGFGAGQLLLMVDLGDWFDGTTSESVLVLR